MPCVTFPVPQFPCCAAGDGLVLQTGQPGAAGTARVLSVSACSVGGGGSDGRRVGNHFRRRPGSGFLRSLLLRGGGESARLLRAPVPHTLAREQGKPLLCRRDIRPEKLLATCEGQIPGTGSACRTSVPCRGGASPPRDPQPRGPPTPPSSAMKSEQEESKPGTCRCEHGFASCPAYCSGPWGRRGAAGDDARGRVLCPCLAHEGKGGSPGVRRSCTAARGGCSSACVSFPCLLCAAVARFLLGETKQRRAAGEGAPKLAGAVPEGGCGLPCCPPTPRAKPGAGAEGLRLPGGSGEGGWAGGSLRPVVHFVSWRSWSALGARRGLGSRLRGPLRRSQPAGRLL